MVEVINDVLAGMFPAPGQVVGWTGDGRELLLPGGASVDVAAEEDEDQDTEEDDDEDDEDDEDEDEGDDDGPRGRQGDWKAPSQAEWEREKTARARANAESAARRKVLEQLGVKYDRRTGEPTDPDYLDRLVAAAARLDDSGSDDTGGGEAAADGGEDDKAREEDRPTNGGVSRAEFDRAVSRAESRGEARVEARLKPMLAELALERELAQAGWSGTSSDIALRMISLDEVDVEDGEVVGIADQVADLKQEFPDLFRGRRGGGTVRRGAEQVDGGDRRRRTPPPKPQTWEQRIAARIDGRG